MRGWWGAGLGAVAGGLLFLLTHQALGDDAYITLGYARNLAEHGHWGLLESQTANTATSPLNVWLVALGALVTGSPVVGAGLVLIGSLAATGWWAAELAQQRRLSRVFPAAAVVLLAVNPLLVSTVGLETYLGVAILVGMVRYGAQGHAPLAGFFAGLLVLTRPDLVIVAVVVALVLPQLRRRLPTAAAVGVVVVLPWHVWSWFVLGSAVPDTLAFKAGELVGWDGYTFATGPVLYGTRFTAASLLTALPAAAGLVCLLGWLARRTGPVPVAFALGGVAHVLVFALLGTAPYAWYYAPAVVGLTLCLAATLGTLRWPAGAAAGATAAATVVFLIAWPWQQAPINYNFGTAQQYAHIGTDLSHLERPVRTYTEIGTITYFCSCPLLDQFTSPAIAQGFIDTRMQQAGLLRPLLKVNYYHRERTGPPRFEQELVVVPPGAPEPRWEISTPARGTWDVVLR